MKLNYFFKGLFAVIIVYLLVFYGKNISDMITSMGDASFKNIHAIKGSGGSA